MISRLKCKLGFHDADLVPVQINYVLAKPIDIETAFPAGLPLGRKNTYYWRCKRCKWEKEVGE